MPPELRRLIEQESEALVAGRRRAAASIAIQLRERLEGALVVTHSASATVRQAVLHTPPKLLVCTVSHPVEEGRAFADELRASGLAVELLEDEDAPGTRPNVAPSRRCETVFRDGTLCNKIGTRMLAEAAAEREVPTIVACEVIKLAPIESTTALELAREERELFDLTPPELVHAVVTEEGTLRSDEVHALVDRTPFLRQGYALLGRTP
jgi:translation initiation factor 2B subunit (eIF-2B alpha/beta/delta family)